MINLSFPDERRQAPRRRAQLEAKLKAGLSMLKAEAGTDSEKDQLTLYGSTHDLSATGLSLVLPSFPVNERFCGEEGCSIHVIFRLPTGPVQMRIAPVRCIPLNKREPRNGYFIGARITEIDNHERDHLISYLRTVSQSH